MRLIGLFLVLMKWLFPQKLDSILIFKWLMMAFHMDVLVLKSLTVSTLTGHNTVGACIYKISGRGRKSSVARATAATASLRPLILVFQSVQLITNQRNIIFRKKFHIPTSLFEIWSSNPSVWQTSISVGNR